VETQEFVTHKISDSTYLFQDRSQDDDKTLKRFSRDKVLLLNDFEKDPTNARTVFYLAQTYGCLNDQKNAYKYYALRSEMVGFEEEKFEALYKCGKIVDDWHKLKKEDTVGLWFDDFKWELALGWYTKAFLTFKRIEPLIEMGKHYRELDEFGLSYMYFHLACICDYPVDSHLFINKHYYDYERWHLLGIMAFYTKQLDEGKRAVEHAIAVANRDIDKKNLHYYNLEMDRLDKEQKRVEKKARKTIRTKNRQKGR